MQRREQLVAGPASVPAARQSDQLVGYGLHNAPSWDAGWLPDCWTGTTIPMLTLPVQPLRQPNPLLANVVAPSPTTALSGRTNCHTNFCFHSAVPMSRPSSQNSSSGSSNTIPCPLRSVVGGSSDDTIPPLESATGGLSTLIAPELCDMLGLISDVAPVLNPVHEPSSFDEDFDNDFDEDSDKEDGHQDDELSAAGPSAPFVAQATELPPPKRRKAPKNRHNLTERRYVHACTQPDRARYVHAHASHARNLPECWRVEQVHNLFHRQYPSLSPGGSSGSTISSTGCTR